MNKAIKIFNNKMDKCTIDTKVLIINKNIKFCLMKNIEKFSKMNKKCNSIYNK